MAAWNCKKRSGCVRMIISRTPFRISLFGGGTDYPEWYRHHGGAVIGTTINKYCYLSLRRLPPFFEHRHRIVYSKVECVKALEEIEHPSVRAVFASHGVDMGLELHHDGDLPARSGLGSSSSFTIGLINALRAYGGKMSSPGFLAREAIRIEQEIIGEAVGSQDQIWAAFGGTNVITINPDDSFVVQPVIMSKERREAFQSHLMLFFTGISRIASVIASEKIANLLHRRTELQAMRAMVDEAANILANPKQSLTEIGRLLHENWMIKRQLADNVSTPFINDIYQAACDAGALGGKVLGAGGGGFILLFAEPERQAAIRERLKDLISVDVTIGSPGSKIVIYEPSGLEHS